MDKLVNYNGRTMREGDPVIHPSDHSYRYGDGLFETMKVKDGRILFGPQHFDRLFAGLQVLKFKIPAFFTEQRIEDEILQLCRKNQCELLARVRLSVSRGAGGLYDCDNNFSYLIGCRPLETHGLNENGLIIDVFPDARKTVDAFSNLKSANYLPYVMAAIWAKENKLNDALILNSHHRICDATIANVFWVKDGKIFTPPLSEGSVAGVMRKAILDLSSQSRYSSGAVFGFSIEESILTEEILLEADEVFLTNVTTGLRWVKLFRNKTYQNRIASKLFAAIEQTF
jgi:branched-chain amino acid aminotransferase